MAVLGWWLVWWQTSPSSMTNLSQQPVVEASGWKLIFVHSYLASKPRLCTDEHLPLPVIRAVYETRKAHLSTPAEAVLSRGFRKMLFHPPFSTLWRSWLLSESLPVQVLVLALSLLTQLFLESILTVDDLCWQLCGCCNLCSSFKCQCSQSEQHQHQGGFFFLSLMSAKRWDF